MMGSNVWKRETISYRTGRSPCAAPGCRFQSNGVVIVAAKVSHDYYRQSLVIDLHSIPLNSIQLDSIQFSAMQFDSVQFNSVKWLDVTKESDQVDHRFFDIFNCWIL